MKNRWDEFLRATRKEPEPAESFWYVRGFQVGFVVSEFTARAIMRALSGPEPKRFIEFRDLFGSEVSMRLDRVQYVEESTFEQRQRLRTFQKAREAEEDQEESDDGNPWE